MSEIDGENTPENTKPKMARTDAFSLPVFWVVLKVEVCKNRFKSEIHPCRS
jgi:hypothetical protein